MIAEKLGFVPSDCAFIGDSDVDVLTAKNAGMVGVACAWGYRPEAVLASNSPEFLIHYPRELVNIFN
jgi:phosphoglycolate phosphatase